MSLETYKDIRAVLFDFDDTIVLTRDPKWRQHKFIAKKYYQKDLTDEELIAHWGKPLSELIRNIYNTEDIEGANANIAQHRKNYPKVLIDGALDSLNNLRANGRFTGLITATSRNSLRFDFETLGIPFSLFDHIQTEDDTSVHKPDPRVFDPAKKWLQAHNLNPGHAVYIGDGLLDLKAASGAGFNFIGVQTGLVSAEDFQREDALSALTVNEAIALL